jgi:predicted dehydrogenase
MTTDTGTVRCAVIGAGPHGRRIITALMQMPGASVCAVVDHSKDALRASPVALTARHVTDVEEVWNKDAIDLVCIATNGPSHAELAMAAMKAGARYVMVEKPMACSVTECERMVEMAAHTRTRLAVNHPRRFSPGYRWLRDIIVSGRLGKLREVRVQFPGIGLGCLGTHAFDLVRYLAASDPVRVTAWVDAPRNANPRGGQFIDPGGLVVLEMEDGSRGVVSQLEDGAGPMSLEVHLTAGRIRYDERQGVPEIIARDLAVMRGPDTPAKYSALQPPSEVAFSRRKNDELHGLLRNLISAEPLRCSGDDGAWSIQVLVGSHVSSMRAHAPVALPLALDEERTLWLPVT